jgi:CRISPR system Cascade subunit CasD
MRLTFGVRIDQAGRVERDFQTAHTADGKPLPLSHRYYLADAVFLAVVEGDDALIEALHDAVRRPVFPLYLGRRAFPPAGPVSLGVRQDSLRDVLKTHPWIASKQTRGRGPTEVELEVSADSRLEDGSEETLAGQVTVDSGPDVPISFDPAWRRYGIRTVIRYRVRVPNPEGTTPPAIRGGVGGHEPMDLLGENPCT